MAFDTVAVTIPTPAVNVLTLSYPDGRVQEDYANETGHYITGPSITPIYSALGDFTLAFGASSITLTFEVPSRLVAGDRLWVWLDRGDADNDAIDSLRERFQPTRALLAAHITAYGVVDGALYLGGGLQYEGSTGAAFTGLPAGMIPFGDIYPEHFGAASDGVTDTSTAFNNAVDYIAALENSPSVDGGQGGVIYLRNTSYLVRSPIWLSQRVSIKGSHRSESCFRQDSSSIGPILYCEADVTISGVAADAPYSIIENLRLDGNNAGTVTVTGTATNGSADVVVSSATGISVGMIFEAYGFPAGTRVDSIAGTTITMDQTATLTADVTRSVLFRTAYDITITTTLDSATATVTSAADLVVGMLVDGTGLKDDTIIKEISGTTLTLSKTASGTGTNAAVASVFNYGIYIEPGSNTGHHAPSIKDVYFTQMSGSAVTIETNRFNGHFTGANAQNCKGAGFNVNSAPDTLFTGCQSGSNWRDSLKFTTCATPVVLGGEYWTPRLNDRFHCIAFNSGSGVNNSLSVAHASINGPVKVSSTSSNTHGVTFHDVKFYWLTANLLPDTGAYDAYIENSGVLGLTIRDCHFRKDQDGSASRPDYILKTSGTQRTIFASEYDSDAVETGFASSFAGVSFPNGFEGTYTVNFNDGTNTSATTGTATYWIQGDLVTVSLNATAANIDTTGLTSGNNFNITLPFAAVASTPLYMGPIEFQDLTGLTADYLLIRAIAGVSRANVRRVNMSGTGGVLLVSNVNSGVSDLISFNLTYEKA